MSNERPPDGSGGDRDQSRIPKNVQGLLQLCAGMSGSDTPNENTSFREMSPERRQWLEEALEQNTVSHIEEMKRAMEVIQNNDADVDDKVTAFETLTEWCEHIDFAIDFHKIGGFAIFQQSLESEEGEIRWSCLELIAYLAQNNPYCQTAILQHGLMPVILKMLDTDPNPTVKVKALFAVSCLARACEEGLKSFLSHDGFSVIMRAMQTDIEKVKIKSAFMLSAICTDNEKCKDIVCDIGMIDQLVGHLSEEHSNFHEHLLSALLSIVRGHPRSLQLCARLELNLLSLLQQKDQDLKGKEEFQEEYEYAMELLKLLKTSEDNIEQDVVR